MSVPVTFVHNLDGRGEAGRPLGNDPVSRRTEDLEQIAALVGARAEGVVTTSAETPTAVLEVADRRGADLIVVGTTITDHVAERRPRGTSARIAERAKQSVLVVPIAPSP